MPRYTFIIEGWHPATLNKIMKHWRIGVRRKREAIKLFTWSAMDLGIPKATRKRRVTLTVYGWRCGNLPDKDAFDKVVLDSLVRSGLLMDDNEKGLEGRMQVELVRSKEKRTVIELEDC